MGWDRHKLLWNGNETDKYVPWTTLIIIPPMMGCTPTQVMLKSKKDNAKREFGQQNGAKERLSVI